MKHRKYQLRLSGEDQQAVALLKARLPKTFDKLGEARETARAIEVLFPKIKAEIVSLQRPQAVTANMARTL